MIAKAESPVSPLIDKKKLSQNLTRASQVILDRVSVCFIAKSLEIPVFEWVQNGQKLPASLKTA